MFAVIVNTITILIGASVGLLLRKGLPESISDAMMKGLGLCTDERPWPLHYRYRHSGDD